MDPSKWGEDDQILVPAYNYICTACYSDLQNMIILRVTTYREPLLRQDWFSAEDEQP